MIKSILRKVMPKIILPWHILSGPLKGKTIVTSWHDYPAAILGRTEKQLLKWFTDNVRPGETWIDVGAHYGYTTISLCSLVGPSGHVFAFEPMLRTVGYLSQTRKINSLNHLTIMPFALNSDEGFKIQSLPTTRGMIDSTLINNENIKSKTFMEKIICVSFDWLWPIMGFNNAIITGIKIDVQGMEYSVLQGMKNILLSHHPKLIIEFHNGVDRSSILNFLNGVGYVANAIPIEPVTGETNPQYVDNKSYYFEKNKT